MTGITKKRTEKRRKRGRKIKDLPCNRFLVGLTVNFFLRVTSVKELPAHGVPLFDLECLDLLVFCLVRYVQWSQDHPLNSSGSINRKSEQIKWKLRKSRIIINSKKKKIFHFFFNLVMYSSKGHPETKMVKKIDIGKKAVNFVWKMFLRITQR